MRNLNRRSNDHANRNGNTWIAARFNFRRPKSGPVKPSFTHYLRTTYCDTTNYNIKKHPTKSQTLVQLDDSHRRRKSMSILDDVSKSSCEDSDNDNDNNEARNTTATTTTTTTTTTTKNNNDNKIINDDVATTNGSDSKTIEETSLALEKTTKTNESTPSKKYGNENNQIGRQGFVRKKQRSSEELQELIQAESSLPCCSIDGSRSYSNEDSIVEDTIRGGCVDTHHPRKHDHHHNHHPVSPKSIEKKIKSFQAQLFGSDDGSSKNTPPFEPLRIDDHQHPQTKIASNLRRSRSLEDLVRSSSSELVKPGPSSICYDDQKICAPLPKKGKKTKLRLSENDISGEIRHYLGYNKRVSFGTVTIREYERMLGNNPSCSNGPPLGIGWRYNVKLDVMQVEKYEWNRPPRRTHYQMRLTSIERESILHDEWDVSRRSMRMAQLEVKQIHQNRVTSYHQRRTESTQLLLELSRQKFKRLLKRQSKKQEQEKLWEEAEEYAQAKGRKHQAILE